MCIPHSLFSKQKKNQKKNCTTLWFFAKSFWEEPIFLWPNVWWGKFTCCKVHGYSLWCCRPGMLLRNIQVYGYSLLLVAGPWRLHQPLVVLPILRVALHERLIDCFGFVRSAEFYQYFGWKTIWCGGKRQWFRHDIKRHCMRVKILCLGSKSDTI